MLSIEGGEPVFAIPTDNAGTLKVASPHKNRFVDNFRSSPNGNRTRISALRGLRPQPLDDRAESMENAKIKMKKERLRTQTNFSLYILNFALVCCPARARTWTSLIQSQVCYQLHHRARFSKLRLSLLAIRLRRIPKLF
jgi:hypothetical protein